MSLRLLTVCGLFAIAAPVSAQVYNYGHGAPIYNRYQVPNYRGHHHYGYRPNIYHQPHSYSYEYVVPESPVIIESHINQYGPIIHGNDTFYDGFHHDLHVEHRDLQPNSQAQPYQDHGHAHHDHGQFGDTHQHGSGQAHSDHGHAHQGSPRPMAPQDNIGRPQEYSRGRQFSPPSQRQFPSDGQFLEPPALPQQLSPRTAVPQQMEAPLGDGPPPPTVPTFAPPRSSNTPPGSVNF